MSTNVGTTGHIDHQLIAALIGAGASVIELQPRHEITLAPMALDEPNRGPRRKRGKGNKYHK